MWGLQVLSPLTSRHLQPKVPPQRCVCLCVFVCLYVCVFVCLCVCVCVCVCITRTHTHTQGVLPAAAARPDTTSNLALKVAGRSCERRYGAPSQDTHKMSNSELTRLQHWPTCYNGQHRKQHVDAGWHGVGDRGAHLRRAHSSGAPAVSASKRGHQEAPRNIPSPCGSPR